MAIAAFRNEIRYLFIAGTATEDVFLPELSQGVFLKPLRKILTYQPAER
jgi:hypothetical protein